MNANGVNEVINNICEKIGIGIESAKEFVPMLAKYEVMHNVMWAMFWLFLIGFAIGMMRGFKKDERKYSANGQDFKASMCRKKSFYALIVTGFLLLFLCNEAFSAIEWGVNPEVKSVEYVLDAIDSDE